MDLREIAAIALDEAGFAEDVSLTEHDRRFHPGGFTEGQNCKFRRDLAHDDGPDKVVSWSLGRDTDGKPGGVSVAICDITDEDSDAIVNAANRWMLGGGGVDGAIHRAAGPKLLEECERYPADEHGYRVQTGDAKITGGGNLKAKFVIHTAGPDMRDRESAKDPENGGKLLRSSYRRSLEEAKKAGAKSVSVPSISTGIFGYPLEKAAQFAAEEITEFLAENPEMSVRMCIYDPWDSEKIAAAYTKAFQEAEGRAGEAQDEAPEVRNLRHLLRTNAISKKEFASSLAALAALGKVSKARIGLLKRQMFVEDAADPMTDLEKHDAKYHGGHYDGKSACKYRDEKAKGDNVDQLDPENVEGEEIEKSGGGVEGSVKASARLAQDVADAKAALDKVLQSNGSLKDVGDALADYEKAYRAAAGGAGVSALQGLLAKIQAKSPNGIVAQIVQRNLAAAQSASATANLPQGTLTPDEARNYAATEIAKMLGANLTAAAAPAAPAASSASAQQQAAPTTSQPSVQPSNYGPHASLPHNFTQLPSGMDLDDFASWPRGGGSTGLRIYTDPNTGKKYGVKKSGGMPGGQNIPKQVLAEDWMADQALRMAGLNAPDGILETNPTDGEYYKVTEWNSNVQGGIGNTGSSHAKQLSEAYPMMAFLYNMDASQNGDNILVDNNGDLVFVDNGSSFGNRAQGGVNKWFVGRDDADSTNSEYGVAQLAQHDDQTMWANALGLGSINGTYGNTIGAKDQDTILKEAAKYEMGKIARNVAAEMQSRFGVKPTDKKYQNLVKWADSLDKLSAKYKTSASPSQQQATAAPTPQPTTGNQQQTTGTQSSTGNTAAGGAQSSTGQFAANNSLVQQWLTSGQNGNPGPKIHSSWAQLSGRAQSNAMGILTALTALSHHTTNQQAINRALTSILTNGTFTPNARGAGGTVTGANLPRKGIQALQRQFNQALNPNGYNMQVHNNGNITFSATNRSIANAALAAAGQPTGGAQTGGTQAASAKQQAASAQPPSPSATQANPTAAPKAWQAHIPKAWQAHIQGLQAGPGAKNQQLNNAYQGISNWLNGAGV